MMATFRIVVYTLSLVLLSSSCAYFNTFHNTKKLYNEAAKEREKRRDDKPTPAELRKYDDTITKASKILEVYSDSKYVDDAIFILGECFYYKGDYIKAQRKFQELITYFPESPYFQRARVWLARSTLELGDDASTNLILSEILESDKLDDNIRSESQLLLAQSLFKRERYVDAEIEFQKAAENAGKKDIRAEAYSDLGKCQLIMSKFDKAVQSFQSAVKHSPDKNFEFDARLNHANALKLAQRFDEGKQICVELFDNEYYENKHGLVKLERADILYHEGKASYEQGDRVIYERKLKDAIEAYELITIEHKASEASAAAYYRMAEIYMNDFGAFALAQENFRKVVGEFRRSTLVAESTRIGKDLSALVNLNNQVKKAQGEQLMSKAGGRKQLTRLQLILLEYGNHPEVSFLQRQAELTKVESPDVEIEEDESGVSTLVANKLQLAEVYLFQFGQVDSALQEYFEIIQLFPDHEASSKALYSAAYIYENELHDKSKTDSLLSILIDRFPESVQAFAARSGTGSTPKVSQSNDANSLYREAELRLFFWNQTELAIDRYNEVIDKYPDSDYAAKALFAIGWIHEQVKSDNDSAADIYRRIVKEYPGSEYAAEVGRKLRTLDAEVQKSQMEAAKEEALETEDNTEPAESPNPVTQNEERDMTQSPVESGQGKEDPKPQKDNRLDEPVPKPIEEEPIPE